MQLGGRSEVVLMLRTFLLSLSQKSRKDEMRGEFQTAKTSGYTDQVNMKTGFVAAKPIELVYLFSPLK